MTTQTQPARQIRIGAYANGELVFSTACHDEREAQAIGKALESQGYIVRLRTGASLPATLSDESKGQ